MWQSISKEEKEYYVHEAKLQKKLVRKKLRKVEEVLGMKLKKPTCPYSVYMQERRPIEKDRNPHLSQA